MPTSDTTQPRQRASASHVASEQEKHAAYVAARNGAAVWSAVEAAGQQARAQDARQSVTVGERRAETA